MLLEDGVLMHDDGVAMDPSCCCGNKKKHHKKKKGTSHHDSDSGADSGFDFSPCCLWYYDQANPLPQAAGIPGPPKNLIMFAYTGSSLDWFDRFSMLWSGADRQWEAGPGACGNSPTISLNEPNPTYNTNFQNYYPLGTCTPQVGPLPFTQTCLCTIWPDPGEIPASMQSDNNVFIVDPYPKCYTVEGPLGTDTLVRQGLCWFNSVGGKYVLAFTNPAWPSQWLAPPVPYQWALFSLPNPGPDTHGLGMTYQPDANSLAGTYGSGDDTYYLTEVTCPGMGLEAADAAGDRLKVTFPTRWKKKGCPDCKPIIIGDGPRQAGIVGHA